MHTSIKLAVYSGLLAAAFAGAYGIGSVAGPADEPSGQHVGDSAHAGSSSGGGAAPPNQPAGLQVSDRGYTMSQITAPTATGEPGSLSFTILGPDGRPVTEFTPAHEKDLHLIVVRSDTAEYRHVHPVLDASGAWSIDWEWQTAGTYKAFADFVPTAHGDGITLARTLEVAGEFTPASASNETRSAEVGGYAVSLSGDLVAGQSSQVTATIEQDGRPVTTLEPYLGAYGHLVALRDGDLAYLHVHPEGEPGDGVTQPGPTVSFVVEVPTAGTYRLFLDFQIDGQVHTADFTVGAAGAAGSARPSSAGDEHPDH